MYRRAPHSSAGDVPQGMATQLAVMLSAPGKKQRKPWGQLCNLTKEMRSLVLGYPDAEVLLRQIMGLVVEKVSNKSVVDDDSKAIPLLKDLIILVADQLNMIPLGNSAHVPWDTTFSEENFDAKMKKYTVLSIFEAPSPGESDLPIPIFKAMIPVMDPKFESMQTKGIWISRCIDSSMLIMDIKGLDQRQGGKETSFGNQATHFALTVSDIMIVSISIINGSLEQRSGDLFQTIFQERTKLDIGLTKILVVVQNYDGKNSLQILRKKVMETLEQIWRSVSAKSMAFSEYIQIIEFNRVYAQNSEDFRQQVTTWKKHLSATVLPSSFLARSKTLWDRTKQNERFDLPFHMMLLETLYCQQIAKARVGYFEDAVFKAEESPVVFTEVACNLVERIKVSYPCVSDNELMKMVNKELFMKIQEKKSKEFKEGGDAFLNYYEKAVEPYVMTFTNLCEDLKIIDPDYFGNNCGVLRKELTSYISLHILSLKEEDARNAIEKEQIRSAENIEALTVRLDQRTEVRQRRELKLLQEKEQLEQEIKRVKEELELAKTKIPESELTVPCIELNKDKDKKEELEHRVQMLEQNKCKCNENIELIVQMLGQNKCKCEEKIDIIVQMLDQNKDKRENHEHTKKGKTSSLT